MGWKRALVLAGAGLVCVVVLVITALQGGQAPGRRSSVAAPTSRVAAEQHTVSTAPPSTGAPRPADTVTPPSSTTPPPAVEVAGVEVTRPPDPPPAPEAAACPSAGGESTVEALLNGHRSVRCENGLGDVALDPAMSEHAQFHAERLLAAGACASLFHSSELPEWYGAGYWGENAGCVAWSHGCWSDTDYLMNGWMNSDEHRPNILNPEFHWIGIGIACDGQHTYFVVQFRS
jgi:uncharacterized protein YkwD